jgi:thiamine pyrophosphate-dependent acetolactate synthase large subunit-like protein
MDTIRLTTAQAIVRWLLAQRIEIDGVDEPVFPGAFGIFGHGNVTCLAEALEPVQDRLPTWRGHNEQSMALAAVAFAKARRRRQVMIATSSIGPGSTNMVTAAAVAHANRLPLLLPVISSHGEISTAAFACGRWRSLNESCSESARFPPAESPARTICSAEQPSSSRAAYTSGPTARDEA